MIVSVNSSTSGRIGQRRDRDATDEKRRQPGHHLEVSIDLGADGRSLHFDHHLLAGVQRGNVHLGDRGSGKWLSVERGEHILQRSAQVGFDHLAHHLEALGRHLVPEQGELRHQFVGEDAGTRADDLTQLDVGGSQVLGRLA